MKITRFASPRHAIVADGRSKRNVSSRNRRLSTAISRNRVRKSGLSYRRELRAEMIAAYGGKCECVYCGIGIAEFLTLEHKRKDGAAHRRRVGQNAQAQLLDLKRQGWPADDYGLLCFNCNIGAGTGECPHATVHASLEREARTP